MDEERAGFFHALKVSRESSDLARARPSEAIRSENSKLFLPNLGLLCEISRRALRAPGGLLGERALRGRRALLEISQSKPGFGRNNLDFSDTAKPLFNVSARAWGHTSSGPILPPL